MAPVAFQILRALPAQLSPLSQSHRTTLVEMYATIVFNYRFKEMDELMDGATDLST